MVTSFSIPVLTAILGLVMIFAAEPIIKVNYIRLLLNDDYVKIKRRKTI